MNLEKIGNFIKQLRIENKLTQQQLADKIPITREAVSKWERGKNKPDRYTLEILANLFNVTTEELILGRRNESTNIEENKQLTLTLYDENNKKQKKLKILFIILFVIIILFFIYYFFVNFNSIKIYTIKYDQDGIVVKNGIFVSTREKFYFNFSDIICPEEITGLALYYKDNDEDKVIYETKGQIIILYDYYQYDAYFKFKDLQNVLDNLYIKIICEDKEYNVKLNIKKDFANNKLFFNDFNKLLDKNNNLVNSEFTTKINKLIDISKNNKDYLIKTTKKLNININFFEDMKLINITRMINTNICEEWNFYINTNELIYKKYEVEGNILSTFTYLFNQEINKENYFENNKELNDEILEFIEILNSMLSEN